MIGGVRRSTSSLTYARQRAKEKRSAIALGPMAEFLAILQANVVLEGYSCWDNHCVCRQWVYDAGHL